MVMMMTKLVTTSHPGSVLLHISTEQNDQREKNPPGSGEAAQKEWNQILFESRFQLCCIPWNPGVTWNQRKGVTPPNYDVVGAGGGIFAYVHLNYL